jgi:hypothetical protein
MMKPFLNFSKSVFIFLFTLLSGSGLVLAFDCADYASRVEDPKAADSILYLICPLQGAINIALYFVGAVLIILILYGAIKAITAVGDPKQLEGAKMTWSYAFFGFVIIIFAVTLVIIIAKLFGINIVDVNVAESIGTALDKLYTDLR